jgi:hypothetical protein
VKPHRTVAAAPPPGATIRAARACAVLLGSVVGAFYGALHDAVTFALAPESFEKLKFDQFRWLAFVGDDRVRAALVGAVAAAPLGALSALLLAHRLAADPPFARSARRLLLSLVWVLGASFASGGVGLVYGASLVPVPPTSVWARLLKERRIVDAPAFVRVACAHNGGYVGAMIGLGVALLVARRPRPKTSPPPTFR